MRVGRLCWARPHRVETEELVKADSVSEPWLELTRRDGHVLLYVETRPSVSPFIHSLIRSFI